MNISYVLRKPVFVYATNKGAYMNSYQRSRPMTMLSFQNGLLHLIEISQDLLSKSFISRSTQRSIKKSAKMLTIVGVQAYEAV